MDNSDYYKKVHQRKGIEIARQRGEEVAKLKHKKEQLEQDRLRLLNDLD